MKHGGVIYHKRDKNFKELKNLMASQSILRPPDFTKPFTLYTDASHYCVAYNLSQHDCDRNTQ